MEELCCSVAILFSLNVCKKTYIVFFTTNAFVYLCIELRNCIKIGIKRSLSGVTIQRHKTTIKYFLE